MLLGVKSVTIHDKKLTQWEDLSSQFYLCERDLGRERAEASFQKLAELNPHVHVSNHTDEILPEFLLNFNVVVLIDQSLSSQASVADFCHANGICVIAGDVRGVFGTIFCDFGENFVIHDNNGEAASSSMIAGITRDFPCLVSVLEDTRHNLETGDVVVLTEVEGMSQLNGKEFSVTVKDPFSFEINEDTRESSPYVSGGYANQVKQSSTISFQTFSGSFEAPEFSCDVMKMHHTAPLHAAWRY